MRAFDQTINELQVDYLDLYLIHWPVPRNHEADYKYLNQETWKAMEFLYNEKKIKGIGVSNFLIKHLKNINEVSKIKIMVNQLEIHPFYQQKNLVEYCKSNDILVQSWSPFQSGRVFDVLLLEQISRKYFITVAELCLQWLKQQNVLSIPKSANIERMKQNFFSLDKNIKLESEDLSKISFLDSKTGHANYWNYKRQLLY